ncbi:hypothetical protein PW5551_01150 [Petrotoga sp. 9PW.55.5.1]|nr:hypothetical protein PW5551_01150 [Petrotoga sp. 9PW.55.5.1]
MNIGLNEKAREEISKSLNSYLSNLQVLHAKLHNLHWNVEGQNFFKIHEKLEEFYDTTSEQIDEVAERILSLGYRPLVKLNEYANNSNLKEIESKAYDGLEALEIVLEDFYTLINETRNLIKLAQEHSDESTADMLIGYLKEYEKNSWMIRATLS